MDRAQGQLTLDDLGTPLADVTFCVIDLETTGGSPTDCGITEVGAVKLRGGECLGTFQTLVNPGLRHPARDHRAHRHHRRRWSMPAPRIETVLPALLEFVGDAVIVGHNVRFDVGFLQAALERDERPRLSQPHGRHRRAGPPPRRATRCPTASSAPSPTGSGSTTSPSHRALDDALATGDLLHVLLERAGGLGVTGLDDLLALPDDGRARRRPPSSASPTGCPAPPASTCSAGARGEVLYVGKATNLRARVRSYFSGDERRKIGALLRETQRIDHVVHPHPLSAAVHEVRLIHRFTPRYNRQSKDWSKYVLREAHPRRGASRASSVVEGRQATTAPSTSVRCRRTRVAQRVIEAIQTAVPLRRCTQRVGRTPSRSAPCASAQLGVSTCPCAGGVDPERVPAHRRSGGPRSHRRARAAALPARRPAGRARPRRALRGGRRRPRPGRGAGRRAAPPASLRRAAAGGTAPDRGPRPGRRRALGWPAGPRVGARASPPPPNRATTVASSVDTGPLPPLDRDLADELACVAAWLDRSAHQRHPRALRGHPRLRPPRGAVVRPSRRAAGATRRAGRTAPQRRLLRAPDPRPEGEAGRPGGSLTGHAGRPPLAAGLPGHLDRPARRRRHPAAVASRSAATG